MHPAYVLLLSVLCLTVLAIMLTNKTDSRQESFQQRKRLPLKYVQYIRIVQPQAPLEVSEVRVFLGARNIAPVYGHATQSSTKDNDTDRYGANRAISGTHAGARFRDYARTNGNDASPWWELDLGRALPLSQIIIHFPERGNHPRPTSSLYPANVDQSAVEFLDDQRKVVQKSQISHWRENIVIPINQQV